jgi:hypothetical protein
VSFRRRDWPLSTRTVDCEDRTAGPLSCKTGPAHSTKSGRTPFREQKRYRASQPTAAQIPNLSPPPPSSLFSGVVRPLSSVLLGEPLTLIFALTGLICQRDPPIFVSSSMRASMVGSGADLFAFVVVIDCFPPPPWAMGGIRSIVSITWVEVVPRVSQEAICWYSSGCQIMV